MEDRSRPTVNNDNARIHKLQYIAQERRYLPKTLLICRWFLYYNNNKKLLSLNKKCIYLKQILFKVKCLCLRQVLSYHLKNKVIVLPMHVWYDLGIYKCSIVRMSWRIQHAVGTFYLFIFIWKYYHLYQCICWVV